MNAQVKEGVIVTPPAVLAEYRIEQPSNVRAERAKAALEQAKSITIASDDDFTSAAAVLSELKGRAAEIEADRKALKAPVLDAGRKIDAYFGEPLDFLASAEKIIKGKLVTYQNAQEKLRLEEQREAERKAERERAKLAERAAKAEAAGKADKADDLRAAAAMTVAPVIQREAPKVKGLKTTKVWKYKVVDASKVNRQFLMLDDAKIAKLVKALGPEAAITVGGIEVVEESILASGSR